MFVPQLGEGRSICSPFGPTGGPSPAVGASESHPCIHNNMLKTSRTFQKTDPPTPLFFLPTVYPAPDISRPPVNGTLTHKTPMILFRAVI